MPNTITNDRDFITELFCHAAVALLLLIECICWLINEALGHHNQQQQQTKATATPPQRPPITNPLYLDLQPLTVKQLRTITGLSNRKAKRKADLIHALAYC